MKYLERKLKVGSTFISRPIQKAIGWLDERRGYEISRPIQKAQGWLDHRERKRKVGSGWLNCFGLPSCLTKEKVGSPSCLPTSSSAIRVPKVR